MKRCTVRMAILFLTVLTATPSVPGQPDPKDGREEPVEAYLIRPTDVLRIECLQPLPKPPYRLRALDTLAIHVIDALPEQPIQGFYAIELDGTIDLGFDYDTVKNIAGKTLDEARAAIRKTLKEQIKDVGRIIITLAESRATPSIQGEHVVRPDGTVGLGIYGSVKVSGMTIEKAQAAIQSYLSGRLLDPEVAVDVSAYNSSVYYVIIENDRGHRVSRHILSGSDTVMDALANVEDLPNLHSKRIWLIRRGPGSATETADVDWRAISRGKSMATNQRLRRGDVLVIADKKDP